MSILHLSLYSFKRSKRIRQSNLFKAIFSKPQYRCSDKHLTALVVVNEFQHPRLGIVVSKRNFAKAHVRNYLKRLIRESFRLYQSKLDHLDIIVIAKKDLEKLSSQEIFLQIEKLWQKLQFKLKNL